MIHLHRRYIDHKIRSLPTHRLSKDYYILQKSPCSDSPASQAASHTRLSHHYTLFFRERSSELLHSSVVNNGLPSQKLWSISFFSPPSFSLAINPAGFPTDTKKMKSTIIVLICSILLAITLHHYQYLITSFFLGNNTTTTTTITTIDTNAVVQPIFDIPTEMSIARTIVKAFKAIEKSEGAGAKVRRSIGVPQLRNFSPFLMLDHFSVGIGAGFPDHPHRYVIPTLSPLGGGGGGEMADA